MNPAIFVGIGVTAGILSGLFGIGGGVLIVPALAYFANFPLKSAVGTSLGALLLPVGIFGAWTYYRSGNLDVRGALHVAAGHTAGVFIGARIVQHLETSMLQRGFAIFLGAMAVRMWLKA